MIRSPFGSVRQISRTRSLGIATVVALVATLGLATGSASAATPAPTASISGTVISATTGAPIADVNVGLDLPGGDYVQFGTTDQNGNYSFTGLAATPYVINFAPGYGDNYVQQWWNNKPTLATATPIPVAPGQAVTGINASLVDGATVTGNVQPTDGGVSGFSVDIEDAAGNFLGDSFTDGNGNYSVSQLPAGSFTASFTKFNGTAPVQWWNDKSSLATADFFTTAVGQTTSGIDATIAAGASGSVSGVVYDSGTPASPLSYVSVQAFAPDGTFGGYASTGADGSYTISGLAPGSYTLEFQPGFFNPTLATQYWQNEPSLAAADYFTVSAGDALTGYNANLAVGGTITGTVLDATAGNAPLANVGVFLYQNGVNAPYFAQTDADGNYTLTGLTAGSYDVDFEPQAPSNDAYQWWTNSPYESGATPVTVANGVTVTGISPVLHAGATISGVVTGKTANGTVFPAGNGWLSLYTAAGALVNDNVQTDGDGNYAFTNLNPGSYTIDFQPQGDTTDFVPQWWKNKSSQATATVITVKAGQTRSDISPVLASTALKPATPHIAGTAKVGSTLTVKPGTWHPGTVALSYQWSRGGVAVDGATGSTYALTSADANSTITVTVTGSESGYTTDSVTSAATKPVTGGVLMTATPTIQGNATVGSVLTAIPGAWGPGTVNLTYKWYRGTARIGGATNATYTLVHADAGKAITVRVTGAEAGFTTAMVASAPTAVVH